jgi:hypothetical protein
VRDQVALDHVKVLHVPTSSQYADIFTKGLPSAVFTEFRSSLNVAGNDDPTAGGVSKVYLLYLAFLLCWPCGLFAQPGFPDESCVY